MVADSTGSAGGAPSAPARRSLVPRALAWLLRALVWLGLLGVSAWACAAIWFDLPVSELRAPLAAVYAIGIAGAAILFRFRWKGMAVALGGFALVVGWWLTLRPSNTRNWNPDVAVLAWAEFEGDRVTVHNVRNCVYRSETDYDVRQDDRTYDLSTLKTLDMFLIHWGSPLIAHPIISFGFEDGRYLALSIEVRKEVGEGYSAVRGFFRQFERMYIIADERDVVWLRTNVRKGEDVRLYRLRPRPGVARKLLVNYLTMATELRDRPAWYNALTGNCTTDILPLWHKARGEAIPFDWRVIANGKMDEWFFEKGAIAGLPTFAAAREAALINPRTAAIKPDENFSRAIREGLPGFGP